MNNKTKYIVAGITLVVLLLFNQAFIQYWLNKKQEDAYIINMAGRQRMLSQKINLWFYQKDSSDTSTIQPLLKEWQTAHEMLIEESKKTSRCTDEGEELLSRLNKIGSNISWIKESLKNKKTSIERVNENQQEFLSEMEVIVSILESEAKCKLNYVIRIEILFALLSLLVVILEVTLIYLPIQKQLESEKNKFKTLLQELNHRIKNNLFMISNWLYIMRMKSTDPQKEIVYDEVINMIQTISTTHELFSNKSENEMIELDQFIERLFSQVINSYTSDPEKYTLTIDTESVSVPVSDSQLIGLVINEILSNILKYAYGQDQGGEIYLGLKNHSDHFILKIKDFGGIAEQVTSEYTQGKDIIKLIVEFINGTLLLEKENGYEYTIKVPFKK